jgi:hypothetical protein
MVAKTVYKNVILRDKDGTLTLSQLGLSFQSSDDDEKPVVYRAKWEAIQNYKLSKATAEKALMRMTVLKKDQEVVVIFQMGDGRPEAERLRDDMKERIRLYQESLKPKVDDDDDEISWEEPTIVPKTIGPTLDFNASNNYKKDVEQPQPYNKDAEQPKNNAANQSNNVGIKGYYENRERM